MSDTFAGGVQSIVKVLRPKGHDWHEEDCSMQRMACGGFPMRAFRHRSGIYVLSAVEVTATEGKVSKRPEYHISISRHLKSGRMTRVDGNEAKWVLKQFGLEGAEEDNHVPNGRVRNWWRTVATPLIGLECECKESEPAIVEDRGDFIWRGSEHR
jgi:hypothetical protein